MKILVDADACPKPIKEVLYRAAKRRNIQIIFFANHAFMIPPSSNLKFIQVPKGFDVADGKIVEMVEKGDLVITADIPLADAVIEKHATAINVRGTYYTKENIKEKLAIRDVVSELRDMGQVSGGPPPFNKQDLQKFANALDQYLAKKL